MEPIRPDDVALRPWATGDLDLLQRLLGDPRMTEHLGGPEAPDKIVKRHERYLAMTGPGPDLRHHHRPGAPGSRFHRVLGDARLVGRNGLGDGLLGPARIPGSGRRDAGHGPRHRARRGGRDPQVDPRVPVGGQRAIQCRVSQGGLHAPRRARLRVPAGQLVALQRLGLRALGAVRARQVSPRRPRGPRRRRPAP